MKTTPKPREFRSKEVSARAKCLTGLHGERVVDTSLDVYDDKHASRELRRYAKWLVAVADWLEESE